MQFYGSRATRACLRKMVLRVDVAFIRSGSTMAQTLVSGEIQMSQMGGPAMVAAGVAGMDVTYVAVALNTTPIVIMGNVSKMEELKGKSIGVTRYGSNTDISARFAIQKAGLQPEKDVALIQLEEYANILGGMQSGRVAAGSLADPFTEAAKKLGFKEIADIAKMGLEFPFVGIAVKKSYIKDHMDTVQRFRARLRGSHRHLQKQPRIDDEDYEQVHRHQRSGNTGVNRGFLRAQVAARARSDRGRTQICARAGRCARSTDEKLLTGNFYGQSFCETTRR
jgi:ABC-type nitrate/sulfonate/bicarbonate transport system substrate-binding protein